MMAVQFVSLMLAQRESVHLGNVITEWNQQFDCSEVTTLRGRYERYARTPRNPSEFSGHTRSLSKPTGRLRTTQYGLAPDGAVTLKQPGPGEWAQWITSEKEAQKLL